MKVIRDMIQGDTILAEDTQLHGIIAGSVRVSENIVLKLHGIVSGGLTVEQNSTAYLYGMVKGDVINKGGHLEVFGIVAGRLIHESRETIVDPNAKIIGGTL